MDVLIVSSTEKYNPNEYASGEIIKKKQQIDVHGTELYKPALVKIYEM